MGSLNSDQLKKVRMIFEFIAVNLENLSSVGWYDRKVHMLQL